MRSWPTGYGRNTPTGVMPYRPAAIMAMRCCRSIQSRLGRISTFQSESPSRAECCTAYSEFPTRRIRCMRYAYTLHCASRTVSAKLNACSTYVSDTIPDDAPLIIAGDFNDWREQAHRRLLRDAALEEIYGSAFGRPARTFPARLPLLRLDRIYVRNLRHRPLPQPQRPWAMLSDHAPLAGQVCV